MTKFRKLSEVTFTTALWLLALSGVSLGQEKLDAKLSPAALESQIQSLGSQLDSVKSEFGQRLDRIESLIIGQRDTTKGGDETGYPPPVTDGILPDSKRTDHSEPCCKRVEGYEPCCGRSERYEPCCRYAERYELCCRHVERYEPCCRHVERYEPCCRHVERYEPCCRHVEHYERCCRHVYERHVIRYERHVERYEPCCRRYHHADGYDDDP